MTGRVTRSAEEEMAEEFDKHVLALLTEVIQKSYRCSEKDVVSRALLYFLVRVANTWQSIRTLRKHSNDDKVFMIDAATLLRAMLDACFQAEHMVHDADSRDARASEYFDYEHVERYKIFGSSAEFVGEMKSRGAIGNTGSSSLFDF